MFLNILRFIFLDFGRFRLNFVRDISNTVSSGRKWQMCTRSRSQDTRDRLVPVQPPGRPISVGGAEYVNCPNGDIVVYVYHYSRIPWYKAYRFSLAIRHSGPYFGGIQVCLDEVTGVNFFCTTQKKKKMIDFIIYEIGYKTKSIQNKHIYTGCPTLNRQFI